MRLQCMLTSRTANCPYCESCVPWSNNKTMNSLGSLLTWHEVCLWDNSKYHFHSIMLSFGLLMGLGTAGVKSFRTWDISPLWMETQMFSSWSYLFHQSFIWCLVCNIFIMFDCVSAYFFRGCGQDLDRAEEKCFWQNSWQAVHGCILQEG